MTKTSVLVTGFEPFDGRDVNASWVGATSLAGREHVAVLELPVAWGQPMALLAKRCSEDCPNVIVSLGEGRTGWFDIETVGRNTRADRADNLGHLPCGEPVVPGGPDLLPASIDAHALHRRLSGAGFPVRRSTDAGGFLCDELLYTLETLRRRHAPLVSVVFTHVPPFGSPVRRGARTATCNDDLMAEWAETLLSAVLDLNAGQ